MAKEIDNPADLLPRYCSGQLTPDEERSLLLSAAADQDIFDQLMEAEVLRDALNSPELRNYLRGALSSAGPEAGVENPTLGSSHVAEFPPAHLQLSAVRPEIFLANETERRWQRRQEEIAKFLPQRAQLTRLQIEVRKLLEGLTNA